MNELVKVSLHDFRHAHNVWNLFWYDYPPTPDFYEFLSDCPRALEFPNEKIGTYNEIGYVLTPDAAHKIRLLLGDHTHTYLMAYRAKHRSTASMFMESIYRFCGTSKPVQFEFPAHISSTVHHSGLQSTTGSQNVAIGTSALKHLTTGSNNTFIGVPSKKLV